MGNNPQITQQQTQGSKTPLGGPQGNLFNDIWGNTSSWLNSALGTPTPQNVNATYTPNQWAGANMMAGVAPSLGQGAAGTGNLLNQITSGFFTNPLNNPNFQGAVKSVINPANTNLFSNILPAIGGSAAGLSGGGGGAGAYGSATGQSPQNTTTQQALQGWGANLQNTLGSMANNAYNAGLSLFSLVPGLGQSYINQSLAPSQATEAAGALQQQGNQIPLTNMLQNYMMKIGFPEQWLQGAAGIGTQGGFGNTTQNTQNIGATPSMSTQWLQGILGALGMGNSLFGKSGMFGPGGSFSGVGSGLSSAGTGIGNLFSGMGSSLAGLFA